MERASKTEARLGVEERVAEGVSVGVEGEAESPKRDATAARPELREKLITRPLRPLRPLIDDHDPSISPSSNFCCGSLLFDSFFVFEGHDSDSARVDPDLPFAVNSANSGHYSMKIKVQTERSHAQGTAQFKLGHSN